MRIIISLFILTLGLFEFGCALGPLTSHETARSVGRFNSEISGSYGTAIYGLKWNFGITENWDIGAQYETLSFGYRTKYSFVNSPTGWSFAGALGTGASIGGSHNYIDALASYMGTNWEPYFTLRVVNVTTDPVDVQNNETGTKYFTINSSKYSYGQIFAGSRYWMTKNWLLSMEASTLFPVGGDLTVGSTILGSLALGYRF